MSDKNLIRELYNLLREEISTDISNNNKYSEINMRCNEIEELIRNTISKEDYELFENFVDIYSEILDLQTEEGFVKGFSLANKLRDDSER